MSQFRKGIHSGHHHKKLSKKNRHGSFRKLLILIFCAALLIQASPVKATVSKYTAVALKKTSKKKKSSTGAKTVTAKSFKTMSTETFIKTIGPLATADYQNTGVLASVTIAQAINESNQGRSSLAQNANNLFGMKTSLSGNTWAGSTWKGKVYKKRTKEEVKGKKITITAKFRKYSSVMDSISDHSAYLTGAKKGKKLRYSGLTSTDSYKKQLKILQKGGYCTWSGYSKELSALIQKYHLTDYDIKQSQ